MVFKDFVINFFCIIFINKTNFSGFNQITYILTVTQNNPCRKS